MTRSTRTLTREPSEPSATRTCSPEKIRANRENASRSTGPRTAAGKARSRLNGVTHGLSGKGVALPSEDAEAVELRYQALGESLKPRDERERILAQRAAFLSVRLDRCAIYENSMLAEATGQAIADHDERRLEEVETWIAKMAEEPGPANRRLRRYPEGIDWLLAIWDDLRRDLTAGIWGFEHIQKAENLTGKKLDDVGNSALNMLSAAMYGDFRLMDPPDVPPPADPLVRKAREGQARADLQALVDGEIRRLHEQRAALPLEALARSRAEAPLRRLFDPSNEAVLFRRYETAAARELHRTFALFPGPDDDLTADDDEACAELGSLRNFAEEALPDSGPGPGVGTEMGGSAVAELPESGPTQGCHESDPGPLLEGAGLGATQGCRDPHPGPLPKGEGGRGCGDGAGGTGLGTTGDRHDLHPADSGGRAGGPVEAGSFVGQSPP